MIASGQLAAGEQLPSVREVATEHTVNPMTISKAYALLEAEGLLERHRGKPMTVVSQRRTQAALSHRLAQLDSQIDHLVLAAKQLDVRPSELIGRVKQKWEDSDE